MANAFTAAEVIIICPEFADVEIAVIDRFIALAVEQIDDTLFGGLAKYLGVMLTAHMMTIAGYGSTSSSGAGGSAAGPVTGVTVGDVSVNYANTGFAGGASGSISSSLGLSKYGQEFARLVRMGGLFATVI